MQLEVGLGKDVPGESVTCEVDLHPVVKVSVGVGSGFLLDDDLRRPIQVDHGLLVAVCLDLGDEDNDLFVGLDEQPLVLDGDLLQLLCLGLGNKDVAVFLTDLLSAP